MPATLDEVLAELKALRAEVADLREKQAAPILRGVVRLAQHLGAVQSSGAPSSNGVVQRAQPASDQELEASDGDPTVKFTPKKWTNDGNESMNGRALSTCPPQFLDLYAEQNEYSAARPKQGKEKYSAGNQRTASLARGWAARLRKESSEAGTGTAESPSSDGANTKEEGFE